MPYELVSKEESYILGIAAGNPSVAGQFGFESSTLHHNNFNREILNHASGRSIDFGGLTQMGKSRCQRPSNRPL